jgi:hypothetical protein
VALLPIHIGGRVALILWCDNGSGALDLEAIDATSALCVDAARAFERIIVERKRRRTVADTASVAAAAIAKMAAPSVTPADIARRFAEQRGTQALRSITRPGLTPEPSSRSDVEAPRDTIPEREPTADRSPPIPREEPEVPPGARTTQDARIEPDAATRFARGGRVPIAVDVIGPLPSPTHGDTRTRTQQQPRAFDTRREAESSANAGTPSDGTIGIVAEIVRSGELSNGTANALLGGGERALLSVFRYFPGPTNIDRSNTRARLPPVAEIGPLLRLVVMFRQASGSHLVQQLESYDAERRYYATLCLGDVVYPPALQALVARLFDTDYPTAVIAIESLKAYRRFPEFDGVLRSLRVVVSDAHAASDRRRSAANALGEIRDAEAIPALMIALGDRDGALAGIARRSLVVLSRQDFGQDVEQWQHWWDRAAGRHRVEWLIEGLLHTESNIRHEASEELKKVTGQFFGYYFNLPRRERERAHRRYVDWWHREGRGKFVTG